MNMTMRECETIAARQDDQELHFIRAFRMLALPCLLEILIQSQYTGMAKRTMTHILDIVSSRCFGGHVDLVLVRMSARQL